MHVSKASLQILGYASEELIGRNYVAFVHEQDLEKTAQLTSQVLDGAQTVTFENRLLHKQGHPVTLQWSAVWSEEEALVLCIGRDVTENRKAQRSLELSEHRYKALFDNNPDLIYIEDIHGQITEVNQSFCQAFGLSAQEAQPPSLAPYLSPEMASFCETAFRQALLGNTIRFDLEIVHANGARKVYDTIKQPIFLDGNVVCIQTIAKDITPIVRSYDTIKKQAEKLHHIFESITDAFFVLDTDWNFAYINREAEKLLSLDRHYHLGRNVWQEFPAEVNGVFYQHYQQAVKTGKSVHFEAYFAGTDVWLEVKAFPSHEGISIYFSDISDKVSARRELEKLSLVASNTTNGVLITDSAFTIEWINEGFSKLTGYSLDEALGTTPFLLLHHPKDDNSALDAVKHRISRGEAVSFEILRRKKDGGDIWLMVQVNPTLDEHDRVTGYVFIQSDITEKMRNREKLKMLSLVASKTNNSVLIADSNWRIEWVNDGFTKLLGYTLPEAKGKRPSELLHGPKTDRTQYESLEGKLLQGEPISLEVLNVKKSGEEVWVNVDISAIFDAEGKLTRFVEVQTDITALKTSERELAQSAKDLYRQNRDLQQFTYIVSHNFRAPVASILGLAQLMDKVDPSSELFERSMGHLKESVSRLDTVLKDMNTILGIRDNKLTLEKERVNIRLVAEQALLSLQQSLQKSGGTVTLAIAETCHIHANKAYLYSIFYNLLSNAIKYRAPERALHVLISCSDAGEAGMHLTVTDNGSGFDLAKAQDQVFKLYKRFHTNKKGRGIGLYLVKTHVEAMDGQVEVSSQPGVGTTFSIYLPTHTHENNNH